MLSGSLYAVLETHRNCPCLVDQALYSWTQHRCAVSYELFVDGGLAVLHPSSPRK